MKFKILNVVILIRFAQISFQLNSVFYGFDKIFVRALIWTRQRVPEDILIWGLAFPGGMLGAWLGMQLFRHKTRKQEFHFRLKRALVIFVALSAIVASPFQFYGTCLERGGFVSLVQGYTE